MPKTQILGDDISLIAKEAIINVGEILLPIRSFARTIETEKEGLEKDDTIKVFVAGSVPDGDNNGEYDDEKNNYGMDNGGEHAYKPVVVNKHYKQTFKIKKQKLDRLTTVTSFAEFFKPYAQKVAVYLLRHSLALLDDASFTEIVSMQGSAVFDKDDAGGIETKLSKLVGAGRDKHLVLNMEYYNSFRNSLSGLYANPTNNEVLRTGEIPAVAGFASVLRTSIIPESPKKNVGFATNGTGIIIANGVSSSAGDSDIDYTIATDPVSGIAMAFSGYWDKDIRAYIATVETLCGVAIADPKGLIRLVEPAG
jgi:hypothetical protein